MFASFTEDFCFNIRRLTFAAIDLPFLLLKRKRGEFLILLIWVVLVDMRLYPAFVGAQTQKPI